MTRMNCKLKKPDGEVCGVTIDYDPDTKTAKNVDGTDHFHPKKKNWANKKAMPIEGELELLGKISNLESDVSNLRIEVDKQGEAIRALVEVVKKLEGQSFG